MKLIVGLGNPGQKYENTRHNTGYLTADAVAEKLNAHFNREAFKSLIAKTVYKGEQVIIMKPLTYMNNSGEAVQRAVRYHKLNSSEDVLVIYDDLDLKYGQIRLREKGSAGGHNGMKSIISLLHSEQFCRIRVGIQKNPQIPVIDYVLGKVEKEYREEWLSSIDRAAQAAVSFLEEPFQNVMNRYNQK
ncbi:MAG: aminoacyl-tRNA hydrolase [Erysipelotrichaceae bacterium]|nr:aminoacyl-tRNA hydrolase [Erysipelotrichaceae bacterium]